ncbi:hypothetical protein PHYSODRAFT_505337 [Phytophthora sojae]|uniref:Uncharacterized protein n=1 Tax=Phytophthora sojae (strain P6497) TaxID=1094619 RepID=G4ZNI9_PHYSP|nr:hypothetical protein PHYSODRAFT_506026 [Phytophthora sojae]XP_009528515.1 hypothetical protein PHYSODRAFT_505337 [Phytophthora sojae]EGZ14718.1 hypothetical protein PHYSODRAFT_506026 [Phytophthora sojae]EGZ14766.1 hypothetical protein PHYSODRAFT_505337 [Phytophthora sojae]|eukprot:XP_009528467.1 hypothetical protein PHYSODRAFT_506026 [Phytophthora sojae]
MAEYLLLINYVEVIIPLVYSCYLIATYHMPNHEYYTVFQGMDHARLYQTLKNVQLYCLFQLVSLLLLMYKLKFTLGFPPVQHLGFVLENQIQWVLLHLTFWIIYNVQGSLEHLGWL